MEPSTFKLELGQPPAEKRESNETLPLDTSPPQFDPNSSGPSNAERPATAREFEQYGGWSSSQSSEISGMREGATCSPVRDPAAAQSSKQVKALAPTEFKISLEKSDFWRSSQMKPVPVLRPSSSTLPKKPSI